MKSSKKQDNNSSKLIKRRNPIRLYFLISLAFVLLLGLLVFLIQSNTNEKYNLYLNEGDIAQFDLYSDRNLKYINQQRTEIKRKDSVESVIPVYIADQELVETVYTRINELSTVANEDNWLLHDYRELFSNNTVEEVEYLLGYVLEVVENMYSTGIYNKVPSHDRIEVWIKSGSFFIKQEYQTSHLHSEDKLAQTVADLLFIQEVPLELHGDIHRLLMDILHANLLYDQGKTELKRIQALESVEPIFSDIRDGELLLRKGVPVNQETIEKINALRHSVTAFQYDDFLKYLFVIVFVYFFSLAIFHSPFLQKKLDHKTKLFLLTVFTLYITFILVLSRTVNPSGFLFASLIPGSLIAMLVALFVTPLAGLFASFAMSLSLFAVPDAGYHAFLFVLISSLFAVNLVVKAERNVNIIHASFILAGISALLNVLLIRLFQTSGNSYIAFFFIGGTNGLLGGVLTLGFRPFLDYFLNVPTPLRLMELSDLNAPIFKRMLTRASGTYNHSLAVANLAESAAREIGADPLLARVGAYFHDIGKIDQPEYFIENQRDHNRHNDLKPSMSAAVIKSHVKLGIEKAKEARLPQAVIDIISQHHGNSLISYFFEEAKKIDEKVNPSDFSYNESPPKSKEAAVVMLSDTVEAAARTIKDPTLAKLEKLVWNLIMDKLNARQLSSCDLSFKDLEIMKSVFVHILAGYYHARIEYHDKRD